MKQTKSIKTKPENTKKDRSARRLPSVFIRKLLLRTKQGAVPQVKSISTQGRQGNSSASPGTGNAPANYAEDQLLAGAEAVSRQAASHVYRAGKKLAKDTKEKIRETRRVLKDAEKQAGYSRQQISESARLPLEGRQHLGPFQAEAAEAKPVSSPFRHPNKPIKTKPGKSVKTLRREVRQGKQAAKTAQAGAKAAKQAERAAVQTEKAAVQAAKQTPKVVKAAGQAAKAAVKAAKEAAHAIVSAVKAGVSAVKSGVAAILAGGWAAALAAIIICTVVMIILSAMGIGQAPAWSGTGPMSWPLPGECSISSYFGTRADPFTGDISRHTGVDVAASEGTAIRRPVYWTEAAADGVVEFVNDTDLWGDSYGYYLRIRHDETYETLYAHCSAILVREGQAVKAGEPIALVGSTGNSTGSHLHLIGPIALPLQPPAHHGIKPIPRFRYPFLPLIRAKYSITIPKNDLQINGQR